MFLTDQKINQTKKIFLRFANEVDIKIKNLMSSSSSMVCCYNFRGETFKLKRILHVFNF